MVIQIARIQHNDQSVRAAMAFQIAQHDIAGHRFVKTVRIKAICTRQVDHFDRPAVGKRSATGFALNRHAGIIGNLLTRASQGVKQRALPGIRVADQSDERRHLSHTDNSQSMAAATLLRSATVIRPMRTASGSRHINIPLCSACIVTPGSNPSERKRCPS